MRYSCVIVDDNLLERDDLEAQLGKLPQLNILGTCSDGLEAAALLAEQQVDILFTDIDMPGLSGLGLVRTLHHRPAVVCISAHPQYAAQGFDLDVVDFITKPASFERLLQAVNKAITGIGHKAQHSAQQEEGNPDYFFIRETNTLTRLQFSDVTFIESKGDFSKVHTRQGKSHMTLVSLKNLEASLPAHSFVRVHKQYIVNQQHISSIGHEELTLDGTMQVPVSSSYRQSLLDKVVDNRLISRKH